VTTAAAPGTGPDAGTTAASAAPGTGPDAQTTGAPAPGTGPDAETTGAPGAGTGPGAATTQSTVAPGTGPDAPTTEAATAPGKERNFRIVRGGQEWVRFKRDFLFAVDRYVVGDGLQVICEGFDCLIVFVF